MKKVILVVLLSMLALASCKKDRNCTCTETATGVISGSVMSDTTFTKVSKKEAETKCTALNESFSVTGQDYSKVCNLK